MKSQSTPYLCHILICTNCRMDDRKSCAEGDSHKIRKELKKGVEKRGWKGRVRVSQSGCLGVCDEGPNVIIYPQEIWFSKVSLTDLDDILTKVEEFLS